MQKLIKSLFTIVFGILFVSSVYSAEISISRADEVIGGDYLDIVVSIDSIVSEISSFDLTISYNGAKAIVYAVRPGDLFNECAWEYFNYKHVSKDTVLTNFPDFPVNLINVKGIASLHGAPAPNCQSVVTTLFELSIIALRSRNCNGELGYNPFRFFWGDCSYNILNTRSADTALSAFGLYQNLGPTRLREPVEFPYPGYGFPQVACSPDEKKTVVPGINFVNAGIHGSTVDSIDCHGGDVNLNGMGYEVADLILFINYFLKGIVVFNIHVAGQIHETECDGDTWHLTLMDLNCFLRKINGDIKHGKISTDSYFAPAISLNDNAGNKSVTILTDNEVALAYVRIVPLNAEYLNPDEFSFGNSNARWGQIGDTITMMLIDLDGNPVLPAGEHQLFEYTGSSDFQIEAWVVDMSGQETALKLESVTLPNSPELLQNYPNPFNPSTTIEFRLPAYSDWSIEIYNVTGQFITSFNGESIGKVELEWEGTNLDGVEVASGVYFYKLITADQTSSRKMLLLK